MTAITNFQQTGFGVLLSGPNGVGKSAIGLQAFECCQALGHLAVYIPDAKVWFKAAQRLAGDEYLLEQFFQQNVHRIASISKLCSIFHDRLRGAPVNAAMMDRVRDFLKDRSKPHAIAVIVDEVQHITNAIARRNDPSVVAAERRAANYFEYSWSTWNTDNSRFVRMDIASAHGMRELKLPDGDDWRLRFVRPWPLEVALVALQHPESPAFVERTKAHERILHIAGGVIRKLLRCHKLLPSGRVTQESLAVMEHDMREAMGTDCRDWFQYLDDAERLEVARNIVPLLQGKATWSLMKGAYDQGLVALTTSDVFVAPVSPVAGSILHRQLSSFLRKNPRPLSSIIGLSERGYEFERQMHARLDPCVATIGTKRLNFADGPGAAIEVRVDYSLSFHQVNNTASLNSNSILYLPNSPNFRCDSIIVPATPSESTDQAPNPVLVLEYSVTDPRDSKRVRKVKEWFQADGLIASLKSAHPNRDITILLCWPQKLEQSCHANYLDLESEATKAGVDLFVVDYQGLTELGIVF